MFDMMFVMQITIEMDLNSTHLKFSAPPKRPLRGKVCDVKFLIGVETIGFYKHLLAERSDVFEKMFSSVSDPEKANDLIEIKDASAIGFVAFLDIIHDATSKLIGEKDVCLEVLAIAENYNCDYVTEFLVAHLSEILKGENAIKILLAANHNGFDQLKARVLEFLRHNPAHKLPDSYLLATNPQLNLEVVGNAYKASSMNEDPKKKKKKKQLKKKVPAHEPMDDIDL